jgi:hypothetical protein
MLCLVVYEPALPPLLPPMLAPIIRVSAVGAAVAQIYWTGEQKRLLQPQCAASDTSAPTLK